MVIGIALVVTVISIIGCIEIKKPAIRGILAMLALINIMIVVLAGSFTYTTKYKIHDVASYTSPDGKYELLFQQVGDADWPFGHTHARHDILYILMEKQISCSLTHRRENGND